VARSVLQEWENELRKLQSRISCRFARPQPRGRALSYLRSLIGTSGRKNGWQIAEAAGESTPDGMQRLLSTARWDAGQVRDDLRSYVVEHFGEPEGVLIVDETGFLKRGNKSVGVKRQYSGTAGGTENCQVGVFLCYASASGAAFIDRALYLPREWAKDQERRAEAGIPEEVGFTTKPALAQRMLERAFEAGVPARWVVADALYGSNRSLRMFLERREQPFVLALKSDESLWTLTDRGPAQVRADELLASEIRPGGWLRLSAGAGSKGQRLYEWALVPLFRLQLTEEERAWGHWLLVRRGIEDADEIAYHVVFAPREGVTLQELVKVAGTRWRIEDGFEAAKGEFGMDDYEVRKWIAWQRHITLCLLAHAFVGVLRSEEVRKRGTPKDLLPLTLPEVRRLLCSLLLAKLPQERAVLSWSCWRRRHQLRAKRCHYRRRLERLQGGNG
jgi:SRSO17 transposase